MNLLEEAESLILHQFSKSPKLNGLIKSLVMPFQESLEHLEKLHHGRYIDDAKGETLDVIGSIVMFPRQSMSDVDYRVWLKVAILLNNSSGTPGCVLGILQVLFGETPPIQVDEYFPNVVMFTFFKYPDVPIDILFSIIRRAVPLGTDCQFVDASPGNQESFSEEGGSSFTIKDRHPSLPAFQLDVTRFDESFFADFFDRRIHE